MRSSALRSRLASSAARSGGEPAAPLRRDAEHGDFLEAARALVESCMSVVGAASDCITLCTRRDTPARLTDASGASPSSEGELDGVALARAAAAFAELAAIALVRSNALVALERDRLALGSGVRERAPGVDRPRAVTRFRRTDTLRAVAVPVEALTRRERDVLRLLVRGNTNRQIAAALGLSPRTVESHRANLKGKLGLASRAELVSYAEVRHLL